MRVGVLATQCELCRADSGGSVPLAAPGDESAKASTQESPVWCNRDVGNGLSVTHERLISWRSRADRRMWLALRLPARAACEPRHNTAFVIVKRRPYSGKFAGPLPLPPCSRAHSGRGATNPRDQHTGRCAQRLLRCMCAEDRPVAHKVGRAGKQLPVRLPAGCRPRIGGATIRPPLQREAVNQSYAHRAQKHLYGPLGHYARARPRRWRPWPRTSPSSTATRPASTVSGGGPRSRCRKRGAPWRASSAHSRARWSSPVAARKATTPRCAALHSARREQTGSNRILTTPIEHEAILHTAEDLRDHYGFDLALLPVDGDGRVQGG